MTALRAEGCGRLSAAGCVRFAQGATAPAALRVVDCRSAAMLIKSALRVWLSMSYGMIRMLVIGSLRSPPLSGFAGLLPQAWADYSTAKQLSHKQLYSKHGLLYPPVEVLHRTSKWGEVRSRRTMVSFIGMFTLVHPFATTWHFPSRGNEKFRGAFLLPPHRTAVARELDSQGAAGD